MKFWLKTVIGWQAYDISELEPGKGYLVEVPQETTIEVHGRIYRLKTGWNLVGIG